MSERYRKTWYEINLDDLASNTHRLRLVHEARALIAVVKADAYGHGALKVVERLRQEGLTFFAVSLLEEALELRAKFKDITVLVMGVINPEDLPLLEQHDIVFTISDHAIFEAVKAYPGALRFHIKFDSGMNRLGFKHATDVKKVMDAFATLPHKQVEGLYSHLATSDGDDAFVAWQFERFKAVLDVLPHPPPVVHLSNTSAWLKHEATFNSFTHARIGIGLYGYTLEPVDYGLVPIGTLKTVVSQIKKLNTGEYLGYGITYQASEPTRIAVLPIGYADGWIRQHKGHDVLIKGRRYPIIGNICMDQLFVKIDDSIELGEAVVLMGPGGLDANAIASHLHTINYEVLCSISSRVPRIYIEEAKP